MKLKIMFILLVMIIFSTTINTSLDFEQQALNWAQSVESDPTAKAEFQARFQCMTPLGIGGGLEHQSFILSVRAQDLECAAKKLQDQYPEKAQKLREEAQKTREQAKTYEIFNKQNAGPAKGKVRPAQ